MKISPNSAGHGANPLLRALPLPLLLAIALALHLFRVGAGGLSWDGVGYLTLASNLESAGRYVLEDEAFHTKYFPGLPIVAALSSSVFGGVRPAATAWGLAAAFILLPLVCFGERAVSYRTRLVACFLMVTHHLFLVHSALVSTEILFAAASYAFLVLLGEERRFRTVLLVMTFWAACMFRPEGILLVVSVLAVPNHLRLDYRTLACALALPGLWWGLVAFQAMSGGSDSYARELALPSLDHIRQQLLVVNQLGLGFLCFLFTGMVLALKSHLRRHVYFVASYLALHLVWWFIDVRFYAAVIGSLALLAGLGLSEVAQMASARLKLAVPGFTAIALGVCCLEQLFLMSAGNRQLYQLDNTEYLTLNDPVDELSEQAGWFNRTCSTVLVPERVVYRYVIGKEVPLVEYSSRHDVAQALKAAERPCLVVDMIHYSYWSSDSTERLSQVRTVGCRTDGPVSQWWPPTGYFLEVFQCQY